MLVYVFLVAGFILLIKGADIFVEGSSSVAKLLRVPSVIIGLTVVAFGTSAPEAAVSIAAAVTGNNEIAVGNVIGSNVFNLLVVTGLCGAIAPMAIHRSILFQDFIYSIGAAAVLLVMIFMDHKVDRLDGMILLALFAVYLWKTVKSALMNREKRDDTLKILTPLRSAVYILVGIGAIVLGGDVVVKSASKIAESFGLSQTLIGLTIVAVGTSLPELVTSIVASGKGENGLALGNVVGSNIFNILMVLGASSAITPISVSVLSVIDLLCLIAFSAVTWLFARQRYRIDRWEGIAMVLLYAGYMGYIIMR